GHDGLRPRLRHRRPRRRGPVADRQRRPGPGPELHHRLLPGGGARRRRPAGRQRHGRLRPRHRQQAAGAADRRRARQDPDPRADHSVYPETSAGTVRTERTGDRLMNQALNPTPVNKSLLARATAKLGPQASLAVGLLVLAVLLAMPLLHLLPADHALHVSAYGLTLVGKILCYAIVALALDLVWGYAGLLSLGHGLFFALGGYAMGMYLMRQSAGDGLPAFMSFLAWSELPWYWYGTSNFLWAL